MRRSAARAWVLGLFLSVPVWAGVGVWTPVGGVEPVSRLVADPGDPGTLYALVQLSPSDDDANALWRSTDRGETWRLIQQGIGPVHLLAVDPLRPGRLYAWDVSGYSQPRLWVSENRGDSWSLRYTAAPNSDGPYFWQIIASPRREGVLYGWADAPTAGAAVYRSADGGATWTLRGSVGSSGGRSSLESLLHHPTRNQLEFFDESALYTSHDNGLTWTVHGTFHDQGFYSVARSAAAPDRLYAVPADFYVCLVRSEDGGAHWKRIRSAPAIPYGMGCSSVSVDPADPDHVTLLAEGQMDDDYVFMLSTSRDGGATWSRLRPFPGSSVLAARDGSGTLFAAGSIGLPAAGPYRSTDDGLTWTPSWNGITAGDFRRGLVALPGAGPSPVLLANVLGQLRRSADGGATWQAVALPGGYSYDGLAADADGRTVYVQWRDDRRAFVLKSADGGLTWDQLARVPYTLGNLRADPFRSGRLFAGNGEPSDPPRNTVWRSINGGQDWARRSAGLPTTCWHVASEDVCPDFIAVTSDPLSPDRLVISHGGSGGFFSAAPGIFVSTDGGTRWRRATQGPPVLTHSLAADPAAPGVFLAGTTHGIYRSVDGGDHWAPLQPGLPVDAPVVQLLRDSRSSAWYAVTASQGIFRSADGGSTWTAINDGLTDLSRPLVVLDPQAPDRLFAAVQGQGVWSWSAPGS